MRGHHPESCPRRVLQQGELWVDTSRASGQRVRRVVEGLSAVKMGVAPLVLIYPNVKKGDQIFLKRSLGSVIFPRPVPQCDRPADGFWVSFLGPPPPP